MSGSPLRAVAGGVRLTLKVTPGARRDEIGGLAPTVEGGAALRVSVTAVAEDGKANAAVIRLLAKTWKLPRRDLELVLGATDRTKVIQIAGDSDALARQLGAWLTPAAS